MIRVNDYQRLFDAAPTPYLVLSRHFQIVSVNASYLRATSTRRETILGRWLFEIFPDNPDEPRASGVRNLTASLNRVLELRQADTMAVQRYDIRSPEGNFEERYWSVVNAPVFDDAENIAFILHHVEDVTGYVSAVQTGPRREFDESVAKRAAPEIFIRGQELQRRNHELRLDKAKTEETQGTVIRQQRLEAIGKLTGGVAHDFNNLLTAVLGNLSLLERRCAPTSEEGRLVRAAMHAASRGAQLTQQLLAFSRRETLHPQIVSLDEIIEDTRILLAQAVGDRIELVFNETASGYACFVDAAHLESAVLNLALNARDAMPKGGTLTITTGCTDHEASDDAEEWRTGPYVYVAVADTGTGMPPEVHDRAFEPFFTTKDTGTGLGLSQVYGFAKQSSGHVAIKSVVGEGTTITIYVPRTTAAPARQEAKTPEFQATAFERTVLIVEDDPDVRHVLMRTIAAMGYRVTAAADGREAIAMLAGPGAFDIVVADVMMPHGIDGVEVAKEAKRLRSDIKVLLTSGLSEEALSAEGVASSGFRIFTKPYRTWELARELSSLFSTD